MEPVSAVATFVFIDLETTGLPRDEQNRTKITELSFVAVKRRHLLDCSFGETPRVQHKLTLCINPCRFIDPSSTEITKLSNDLLEHETHFNDNVFNTFNSFLSTLEKPMCLLAHNGRAFDFPILKASLEKIKKELSKDMLCADTMYAYRDILECKESVHGNNRSVDSKNEHNNSQEGKEENNMEMNESNYSKEGIDETDKSIKESSTISPEIENFQLQNETTPKKKNAQDVPATPSKRKVPATRTEQNAKRKLNYGDTRGYTLSNIYKFVLKRDAVDCHRSENDCLLNLEIAAALAEQFVRWVDENHFFYEDVEPMRIGVRLD